MTREKDKEEIAVLKGSSDGKLFFNPIATHLLVEVL